MNTGRNEKLKRRERCRSIKLSGNVTSPSSKLSNYRVPPVDDTSPSSKLSNYRVPPVDGIVCSLLTHQRSTGKWNWTWCQWRTQLLNAKIWIRFGVPCQRAFNWWSQWATHRYWLIFRPSRHYLKFRPETSGSTSYNRESHDKYPMRKCEMLTLTGDIIIGYYDVMCCLTVHPAATVLAVSCDTQPASHKV